MAVRVSVRDFKYLLAWQSLAILLVVLSDIDKGLLAEVCYTYTALVG